MIVSIIDNMPAMMPDNSSLLLHTHAHTHTHTCNFSNAMNWLLLFYATGLYRL